jgi:hypothetical protein
MYTLASSRIPNGVEMTSVIKLLLESSWYKIIPTPLVANSDAKLIQQNWCRNYFTHKKLLLHSFWYAPREKMRCRFNATKLFLFRNRNESVSHRYAAEEFISQ